MIRTRVWIMNSKFLDSKSGYLIFVKLINLFELALLFSSEKTGIMLIIAPSLLLDWPESSFEFSCKNLNELSGQPNIMRNK